MCDPPPGWPEGCGRHPRRNAYSARCMRAAARAGARVCGGIRCSVGGAWWTSTVGAANASPRGRQPRQQRVPSECKQGRPQRQCRCRQPPVDRAARTAVQATSARLAPTGSTTPPPTTWSTSASSASTPVSRCRSRCLAADSCRCCMWPLGATDAARIRCSAAPFANANPAYAEGDGWAITEPHPDV